ncbi:S41 family peptidase [Planctomycetota bacterium]|nr:S41 family peptidase [Planctomycetota bacterium]
MANRRASAVAVGFAWALLSLSGAGLAQEPEEVVGVSLAVVSEPADAFVFVRYTEVESPTERFLGRTPDDGGPLELELEAGPAEVVIFKDGYICQVKPLELRSGGSARVEVRLTRDVDIPRSLVLKSSPAFVEDADEGDEIYVAVLSYLVRFYVEEVDPRELIEDSTQTMVDVLNAVRRREVLLRRELDPDTRRRYYGEELDLRSYPELNFVRDDEVEGRRRYALTAGSIGIEGTTSSEETDSYLIMLHRAMGFVKHNWDTRNLLSDAVLTRCAIEGLLNSLGDDHTHFMTPEMVRDMMAETEGSFGGVGVVVSMRNGLLTVVAPMEGTPGQRAGLRSGDVIAGVDGRSTERMSLEQAVALMRGQEDTPVELTIRRGERQPFTVSIVRAKIELKFTSHEMIGDDVGYLRVTSFMNEELDQAVTNAVTELQAAGAQGLVIDLRNNPGGLLQQAHAIADLFVDHGVVVSTRARIAIRSRVLSATQSPDTFKLPIVVLVNEGSASASEILAGTLREHGLAEIVGMKTFGKGSVQQVLPLDRFGCALALTIATYHLPSGMTPNKVGLTPDLEVAVDDEQAANVAQRPLYDGEGDPEPEDEIVDNQLDAAVARLRELMAEHQ